ncbi:hypothetical protein A5821_001270 [Enterococcus sp. 7F3_DIV0205]|uniref:Gram-positive cocci surface proteins LPxTG domain-containing protein n=1 Tax=Candidatus Enterococcus palustris TaxID=1834189 RepID=A0AAQ3Y7F8_9ENTE|nr:cell wall protein [Enterococcus sp. 7F3_DIV0205]OTN85668.1 hypothetical protein A5821_001614 [Enterococcus sp. 7F3_DIV0205]
MNWDLKKISMKRLLLIILVFGFTSVFTPIASANQLGEGDVGITFKKTEDDAPPPPPHDNTPTADDDQPINKRVRLPNTGEVVKQLTFLVSGMILIVISFAIVLDKQIKASSDL